MKLQKAKAKRSEFPSLFSEFAKRIQTSGLRLPKSPFAQVAVCPRSPFAQLGETATWANGDVKKIKLIDHNYLFIRLYIIDFYNVNPGFINVNPGFSNGNLALTNFNPDCSDDYTGLSNIKPVFSSVNPGFSNVNPGFSNLHLGFPTATLASPSVR